MLEKVLKQNPKQLYHQSIEQGGIMHVIEWTILQIVH